MGCHFLLQGILLTQGSNLCLLHLFTAVLFTIARTRKQHRHLTTNECMRKLWYIYTLEYYSVIKRNASESVLMRWMSLEPIMQSEVSQKDKHKYCIWTYIYMESRKMVLMNLSARQQWRCRQRRDLSTQWGKERVGQIERVALKHMHSVQFSSVAQSCPTLCDPMNRSTPGLPVHHQLPEFTQTHAHWVSDAIQPSHPLSSPSPPAPNPSQHQGLF